MGTKEDLMVKLKCYKNKTTGSQQIQAQVKTLNLLWTIQGPVKI